MLLWLQLKVPEGATATLGQFSFSALVGAIILLFVAWLFIRWMSGILDLLARKAPRSRFLVKWVEPLFRIGVWFLALFSCFGLLAPTRESFFAGLASLGLAIGLGGQDLVKNLIGGLVILGDRPFQLGDRVKIGDAYGEIDHIGLRSTKLTTPDDTRVTIPNADVLNSHVWNANSGVPDCQVVTDVLLPIGTDPDLAIKVGYEAAYCCPYLLLRKPVWVLLTDQMGMIPQLRLRVKGYVFDHRYEPAMMSDITARVKREMLRLGVLAAPGKSTPVAPSIEPAGGSAA